MRKMMRYGKAYGGADPELIEDDIFKIIVRYPDTMTYPERPAIVKITDQAHDSKRPESGGRVEAQVEAQVDIDILRACADGPKSSAEIAEFLGHKQLSGNIRKALPRLREAGLIEYTIPDKPKSRLQKYRLTEKGRLKEL